VPTGNVTFVDVPTSQTLGTVALTIGGTNSQASIPVSLLAPGSHNIQGNYNGDSNFGPSSSPRLTQTVNQASTTTTLALAPSAGVAGQVITLTATITPAVSGTQTPTGTVTFSENGNTIATGNASANGTVSSAVATLGFPTGTHTITASYPGDGNFGASTGTATLTVTINSSKILILPFPNPSGLNQTVVFQVVVSPVTLTQSIPAFAPSGTVSLFDNGNLIGTGTLSSPGENSSANILTSALTVGSHNIAATYAGDSNFTGSTGMVTQVVNQTGTTATTTTLAPSLNPSLFGQSVTFTATVTGNGGTPTGSVTFTDTTTTQTLGTITLTGGQASVTTSTLTAGSHVIQANYGGDTTTAAARSPAKPSTAPPPARQHSRPRKIRAPSARP
jgi:hypothetical protein